jgi:hypothetical protein
VLPPYAGKTIYATAFSEEQKREIKLTGGIVRRKSRNATQSALIAADILK